MMNANGIKAKSSAILYHYPCPDGAFAALAAHLYFKATSLPALFFPNTVYRPLRAQDLPLHEIGDLYLLDFVGPSGFVQEISTKVGKVVILDHHKTAFEKLGNERCDKNVIKVIDMERSGATIAFDYFKEKLMSAQEGGKQKQQPVVVGEFDRVRPLFDYIEDGDLWRWKVKNSKAFSSGLKDFNIEFDVHLNPSLFQQLLSLSLNSVISQGMRSLSHKQKLIDDCLGQSYKIALGGGVFGSFLIFIYAALSDLRSELGHQLASKSQNLKLRGIGAVVYKVAELGDDNKLKVSLRSLDNEDTTPISQEFGGGGHRNASSFMVSSEQFEKWKV
ncbi:DHHA1 domain protein [Senna tora]|uniref:DHHA1 domain protein n=1 Tax=Senna tora TaxID=362788 RepID=A0A834TIR1_9FABA|nr:DHHA1 domain protein [Senna tora]